MNVYLIRHAEAVPLELSGVNADADRPLTPHGHDQCQALAAMLVRQGIALDLVLTSPYLRTRQTAQGLLDHLNDSRPRVEPCEPLAPGGKAGKLARELRKTKAKNVAMVGHMPDLAECAAWLIGSKKARIDFEKAGVALISFNDLPDKGTGCLQWLVTPDWFMEKPAEQPAS